MKDPQRAYIERMLLCRNKGDSVGGSVVVRRRAWSRRASPREVAAAHFRRRRDAVEEAFCGGDGGIKCLLLPSSTMKIKRST